MSKPETVACPPSIMVTSLLPGDTLSPDAGRKGNFLYVIHEDGALTWQKRRPDRPSRVSPLLVLDFDEDDALSVPGERRLHAIDAIAGTDILGRRGAAFDQHVDPLDRA